MLRRFLKSYSVKTFIHIEKFENADRPKRENRSASLAGVDDEHKITQVSILSTLEHQKQIRYTKVFEVADYDERFSNIQHVRFKVI